MLNILRLYKEPFSAVLKLFYFHVFFSKHIIGGYGESVASALVRTQSTVIGNK